MMRSARATASRNERGSAADRRARRRWLLHTFRADVDALIDGRGTPVDLQVFADGRSGWVVEPGEGEPCCRCYRCGRLLTLDMVSPDRIIPGCRGGTYRRDNLRPSCLWCQRVTSRADLAPLKLSGASAGRSSNDV